MFSNIERLELLAPEVSASLDQINSFSALDAGMLALTGAGGVFAPDGLTYASVGRLDGRALSSALLLASSDFNWPGIGLVWGSAFGDSLVSRFDDFAARRFGGDDWLSASGDWVSLRGDGGDDTLIGGLRDDTLNGGWGDDSMLGGAGDDLYVVDARGDVVVENAGEGIDTVRSSISTALGDNVENLVLTGSKWRWGDGNDLDNTITGNFNRNVLSGKDGDDTLNGRGGADTLWGGAGDDRFVFDTTLNGRNVDAIKDFGNGNDVIVLGANVFTALDVGALDVTALEAGNGVARSTDARILYHTATGALLYDGDGSGSGGAVQFALLQPNLTPKADDFVVV